MENIMKGYQINVSIFQGASKLIGNTIVPVIAKGKLEALSLAEKYVNATVDATQWALASFNFPHWPGPTAVAA